MPSGRRPGHRCDPGSDDRARRRVDPDARALRKQFEEEVEGPTKRGQEKIAKARFASTARALSGRDLHAAPQLRRDERLGREGPGSPPWTELSRAYERATGEPPFKIPPSWLAAKDGFDCRHASTSRPTTISSAAIPALRWSTPRARSWASPSTATSIRLGRRLVRRAKNRSIGVHPAYIRTALEKVYEAKALLDEIDAE